MVYVYPVVRPFSVYLAFSQCILYICGMNNALRNWIDQFPPAEQAKKRREIATLCGTKVENVRNWFNGQRAVPARHVPRLAGHTGIAERVIAPKMYQRA